MYKADELIGKINKITDMQAKIQYAYDLAMEANAPPELCILIKLSKDGGKCPICKQEWRHVVVNNRFGDFDYYDPVCRCYPRCKNCGHSMYKEWAIGSTKCYCGYENAPKKDSIDKYGEVYKR